MKSEPRNYFFPLLVVELLPKFIESKMDDMMMMNFLGSDIIAQFKPDAVKEIDFLSREAGRVRTEVKDMLLAWPKSIELRL